MPLWPDSNRTKTMPKLITQRGNRKPKTPPCGRIIRYVEPHSPFQKLVEARRLLLGLSGRAMAKQLGISQSTLWIWMHNENGFPHPKAFKDRHLIALSALLSIPRADLQVALDASRHRYTPQETPMPHETVDAFRTFIEIIDRDPRPRLATSYVRNLAANLYNGSTTGPRIARPAPATDTPTRARAC